MKKIFISIFLAIIILGVLTVVFFPQVWIVIYTKVKFSEAKFPQLYDVPISREIKTPEYKCGNCPEFSYYGFKLKTPWTEIVDIEKKSDGVILTFTQDKSLLIFDSQNQLDLVTSFSGDKPEDAQKIKNFFGEENLKSDYNFYKLTLNKSPDQITIFTPKKEVIAKSILIVLKAILVVPVNGGVYDFITEDMKGFQFGSPEASKGVFIYLFNSEGYQHEIIVFGATQDEIDFILSSIEIL